MSQTLTTDINGKVAFVTGANRGIGKAIVETLLAGGAKKVYAGVRDTASAAPLVAAYGERVAPVRIDVTDAASIDEAARAAQDVQVFINNAGVLKTATPLDAHAEETFRFEFDVNTLGLIRVAQAFAPVIEGNDGGALVQLNSVASLKNFAGFSTYSASKAASYSITQGLREVLAPRGIQVVSVHPGPIATDMADNAGLTEIAEPPSLVGDAILQALDQGEFHAFPDTMAKQVGGAYDSFAEHVVLADFSEGAPA